MSNELDFVQAQETGNQIPIFLKVLCILTFVGAGLGFISGVINVFTVDTTILSLQQSQAIFESMPASPFRMDVSEILEATKKHGVTNALLIILGNSLALFGAINMWKLQKRGFYFYISGQVFPLIGSIFLMGSLSNTSEIMGITSFIGVVISILFSVGFSSMYALNLKHMH